MSECSALRSRHKTHGLELIAPVAMMTIGGAASALDGGIRTLFLLAAGAARGRRGVSRT